MPNAQGKEAFYFLNTSISWGAGDAPGVDSWRSYKLASYIPKGLVLRVLGFMLLACLLWTTCGYAEFGYPRGPQVFTGEYEERCGMGRCGMAPVYVEDTSQLSNPAWVTWVRSWAVVFVVPGVILSIISFILARGLSVIWQATRRGLAVLWWVDHKLSINQHYESLWRERSDVAFELGRNEDAISALTRAKEEKIKELRSNVLSFAEIADEIKLYNAEIASLQKFLDSES